MEYLLEILAGYVDYILDADEEQDTQDILETTDDAIEPNELRQLNRTFTPTKETLSKSPIKSLLLASDSEPEMSLEPEVKETSAFMKGYEEGMAPSFDAKDIACSYIEEKGSLLERLNHLPNLSEALRQKGVDVTDYSISQTDNTDDLLVASVSDIGECIAQSTPYPSKPEGRVTSPAATQTRAYTPEPRRTSDSALDKSIKERLVYLLEQSGNCKIRKRQVRFDIPDSPRSDSEDPNYLLEKQKFEFELEKRILEEELKEKIDQLVFEKKRLRDLTVKKTTPKPPKRVATTKTPAGRSRTPLAKRKTPSKSQRPVSAPCTPAPTTPAIKEYMLPEMLDQFPYLHVSPGTARVLWNKQVKQISALTQQVCVNFREILLHIQYPFL